MADAETAAWQVRETCFEALLAIAALTSWPILGDRWYGTAEQRARAFVFTPIVGFALGAILAAIDRALAPAAGLLVRSATVVLIAMLATFAQAARGLAEASEAVRLGERPAATGIARIGPLGAAAALGAIAIEVWRLAQIAATATRAATIVIAFLLSRWAMVPVGYGLKPLDRWGLGVPYEGGLTFREFAISSVVALGLAMGLYQNVGLAAIVMLALLILAMRLLYSRRLGGVSGCTLAAAAAICETSVIVLLSILF